MSDYKCPICLSVAEQGDMTSLWIHRVSCKRCGDFYIEDNVNFHLSDGYSRKQRTVASSLICRSPANKTFSLPQLIYFLNTKDKSVLEKIDNTLIYMEENSAAIGVYVPVLEENPRLLAKLWVDTYNEVKELIYLLEQKDYVKTRGTLAKISALGWQRLDELRKTTTTSSQGFVAMSFNNDLLHVYNEAIAPAITMAGYDPHRVDQREHAQKIDDEIILQIRRSKFVVADATEHKGGMYYEAGFAHGLGLQVFWTCRDTDFDKLHFDIRQYNCIKWSADDLGAYRDALARRIEAEFGRGPKA